MMNVVEFKGVDIDEALLKAQKELKLTSDNIEFEIVTLGNKGLFGIGKKPAVIKVFLKEKTASSFDYGVKQERKEKKKDRPEKKSHKKHERKTERLKEDKKSEEKTAQPERKEKPAAKEHKVKKEKREKRSPIVIENGKSTENTKKVEEFVDYVARRLDDTIVVSACEGDNMVSVTVTCANTGKLIGKGGRIINSIEYLTTKYARKLYDQRIKVVVQIDGDRK